MSLLDRLAECTAHDLSGFVPWHVEGQPAGYVRCGLLARFRAARCSAGRAVFVGSDAGLDLADHLSDFEARSTVLAELVRQLADDGLVRDLNGEMYPVAATAEAAPWLQLERAAMPVFGARAFGVHLHGFVRRTEGLHMWIARRSRTKTTFPGMLDNMVAGGQPLGLTPEQNVIKECAEEADVPAALARGAVRTGALRYLMETDRGLRDDTLWLYDLELPPDFVPRNADGEVESFELWPIERVMQRVADTRDFKFNCNLTLIDFLLRHGVLGPDHSGRAALLAGLSAHAP